MIWARIACAVTFCHFRTKGRENIRKGQSYVFVSNHQGAFDIFLIYGYLGVPIKWMMKKGLGKIPFVGFACRKAGFIFVDSSTARAAQKSVIEAGRKLTNGNSLAVFPEGSRSQDGHLKRFKKGAYQIAVEQNLSIIPITLNGPYKVMPSGSWNIRPHRIEMIVHQSVIPSKKGESDKETLQELADSTKNIIHSALWDEFK
jgi:1-acyl-sn-glycerol-3-phosphate acyltransferase